MIAKFHRIIHSIPDFIVHFYSKKKKKRKQIFTTLETLVKYNKILSIIILIPRIISIIFNEVRSKNFLSSTEPSSIFNGGKFNSGRRDRERERSKKDESLARSKKNSRWGKGIEKKKKKWNPDLAFHPIASFKDAPLKSSSSSPSALPSLISLYRCSFSKQNYTPPRMERGVLFKIPCPFPRFARKAARTHARTHAEGAGVVARERPASLSLFNLILNWSLPGAETRPVPSQRWEISTDNSWKLALVGARALTIDEIEEDN